MVDVNQSFFRRPCSSISSRHKVGGGGEGEFEDVLA